MQGTRIEKEADIYATNLANRTKCISSNAQKNGKEKEKYVCDPPGEIIPGEI